MVMRYREDADKQEILALKVIHGKPITHTCAEEQGHGHLDNGDGQTVPVPIKVGIIAVKQLDVVVQGSLGKINVKIQSVPHQFRSRA